MKDFGRRSLRIPGFDYTQQGAYFVTICTRYRRHWFGKVAAEVILLNNIGHLVQKAWLEIPEHFNNVALDAFVIMPNHVHGILFLRKTGAETVGAQNFEPLPFQPQPQFQHRYQHLVPKSLGSIVRTFKSAVTHELKQNKILSFQWQRNYYEHVIRNDGALRRIREYIANNPIRWHLDRENPQRTGIDAFDTWLNTSKHGMHLAGRGSKF